VISDETPTTRRRDITETEAAAIAVLDRYITALNARDDNGAHAGTRTAHASGRPQSRRRRQPDRHDAGGPRRALSAPDLIGFGV